MLFLPLIQYSISFLFSSIHLCLLGFHVSLIFFSFFLLLVLLASCHMKMDALEVICPYLILLPVLVALKRLSVYSVLFIGTVPGNSYLWLKVK